MIIGRKDCVCEVMFDIDCRFEELLVTLLIFELAFDAEDTTVSILERFGVVGIEVILDLFCL